MNKGRSLCLGERLLLHIRDGGWHAVSRLHEPLERFFPPHRISKGSREQGPGANGATTESAGEGGASPIAEAIADLRRLGLVAIRSGQGGEEVQATPRRDERFDIDPELEELLPRSPDEVVALEKLVLSEGCRDPLVVWKQRRLLIDGHTRWRLLSLLGWHCEIKEIEFADREAVTTWMWEQHCGRRNLTSEGKSYAHGRAYNAAKQSRGGDRRSKCHAGTSVSRRVADEFAKRYGVGRRTLYRDARFAAALDQLAAVGAPEIRHVVLTQAVRVTRKQVLKLAALPSERQRCLVAKIILNRKPLRLSKADRAGELRLPLPIGKPRAQAQMLEKRLGMEGLERLRHAIAALLRARKEAGNGVSRPRSTNHDAGSAASDGRFSARIAKWGSAGRIAQ